MRKTIWSTIERTLAEKRSSLEILRQLNAEGEGLAQGSQAVLKGMDDPDRFRRRDRWLARRTD